MNGIRAAIISTVSAIPEVFAHAIKKMHEINGRNANLQAFQMLTLLTWKTWEYVFWTEKY